MNNIVNGELVEEYLAGRAILLKSASSRSQEDIKVLKSWLLERVHLFSTLQLEEESVEVLAENILLKQFSFNEVIYEQEDQVEYFFIILRGTVSLLFDPNHQLTMAAVNADSLLQGSLGTKTRASVSVNTSEKKYRSRSRYGTEIEKLGAGDFFGHNALSQRDEASLHSAFANEPVELLAVTAEIFTKVLLQSFQEDFRCKAEYLSSIEFFSGWSPHLIRQLIFTLREKRYHPGECIFRQDVPTHCIYLIKSGSVKISTHNNRKPTDEVMEKIEPERDFLGEILAEAEPIPPKDSHISSFSRLSLLSGGVSRLSIVSGMSQSILLESSQIKSTVNLPEISRRRSSVAPGALLSMSRRKSIKPNESEKKTTKTIPVNLLGFKLPEPCPEHIIEICNLGPGEFLGEVEAMCELQHHLFNAVCISTTVVYEVDLFHMEDLLHKKAPRTLYSILRHIMQKIDSWHTRHGQVQFFEPLKTLLSQVDRKLTSEGANKPVRRQHNYDACTLALMATRSLGKPVLLANARERKNTEVFLANESSNSRPFSSLYGGNGASPSHSPRRRRSTLSVLFSNGKYTPPSLPLKQETDDSTNPEMDHKHHQLATKTNRGIPKPAIKTTRFSFDTPAPRQYRTQPNLMSSYRFPIPPPSPYPVKQDQNFMSSKNSNSPKAKEEVVDDTIETIKLVSPSLDQGDERRCKSANVHQVCLKPTLPHRPKTAGAYPNQTSLSVTVNTLLSEPTKFGGFSYCSQLNHSFPLPTVQLRTTSNTEAIPIATTSEGEVRSKESVIVNKNKEITHRKTNHEVCSNKQQDNGSSSMKGATRKKPVIKNNELSFTVIAHQKQVRISEKLEVLGPKCQPTAPHHAPKHDTDTTQEPVLVPMEVVTKGGRNCEVSDKTESNESDVLESNIGDEESQVDDLETTIPQEYMNLKRPHSTPANSTSTSSSNPIPGSADTSKERRGEVLRCSSAMATRATESDGEQKNKEAGRASSAYKCIDLNYTNSLSQHTNYRFSLHLWKTTHRGPTETHPSLKSMRKEGHLHLARPWTGTVCPKRKSTSLKKRPVSTTRRKVEPKQHVNLTPLQQRPFYV